MALSFVIAGGGLTPEPSKPAPLLSTPRSQLILTAYPHRNGLPDPRGPQACPHAIVHSLIDIIKENKDIAFKSPLQLLAATQEETDVNLISPSQAATTRHLGTRCPPSITQSYAYAMSPRWYGSGRCLQSTRVPERCVLHTRTPTR